MSQEEDRAAERQPRVQRMLSATLHGARFGAMSVVLRNVAAGGVGGMAKQWLQLSEPVEIELPNVGRMKGRIAWIDGVRFGMMFDRDHAIEATRVTRDAASGMDQHFRVMDRFRPDPSSKRPPIGLR
jgi:hypothetical protein